MNHWFPEQQLTLLIFGLPHCPRNRSHTILRKGKASFLGKTEMARTYEAAVKQELEKYKDEMASFRANFDEAKDYLVAEWELWSPDVLTKDGRISKNGVDLDAHKVLQDTVMAEVGIDDAFIKQDTRIKCQGEYKVRVSLTRFNLKDNTANELE